jgi:hypothetical protein
MSEKPKIACQQVAYLWNMPGSCCQQTPNMTESWKPEDVIQAFYKDCSFQIDSRYFTENVVGLADKVRTKYKNEKGPCFSATCADVRYLTQDGDISEFIIGAFDVWKSTVGVSFKLFKTAERPEIFIYQLKATPGGWKISDIYSNRFGRLGSSLIESLNKDLASEK